ncbi:recombination-associated protein RdgC [Thiothrix litoralis]|jgi:recombination associated protein RdgC|uniref:Recombination-associated protein RdgC n=1 Tax=Thiothrix litoralis TaxID=2891210 RepID=A0ABX7WZA9_9GAMM|nr:recombination-associated protein RdgC [Thiothrix litoralis]QTR46964.1 recombination-associated protein RdgC [Thiothrix litoralis]
MWFKNLYLLRLSSDFTLTPEELHEALESKPFLGCGNELREASGWVSPFGRNSEQLVHAANGCLLLTLAHQEKLLPASVIREELDALVAEIEEKDARKVGKREKQDLRDEIEFELLPKAFTRTKKMDAWIDVPNGWMIINSSSNTQGERLTHLLRSTIGSLPVTPPKTDMSPAVMMTQWLADDHTLPAPFALGEECELKGQGEENSVAVFKRHELNAEVVQANLAAGKTVSKLALVWDNKISFMLTDELGIRRVRFLDVLEENLKDADPQSHAEKLDIEFTLMTGEVNKLLTDLLRCFIAEPEEALP